MELISVNTKAMERKITFFWEEKKYVQSSTRVLSFFVCIFLFRFDMVYLQLPGFKLDYYFLAFNLICLIAAFVPKYLHKFIEVKDKLNLNNQ